MCTNSSNSRKCIWCGKDGILRWTGRITCDFCYHNVPGVLLDYKSGITNSFDYDKAKIYAEKLRSIIRGPNFVKASSNCCTFCGEDYGYINIDIPTGKFLFVCNMCNKSTPFALICPEPDTDLVYMWGVYFKNLESRLPQKSKETQDNIEKTKDEEIVRLQNQVEALRTDTSKLQEKAKVDLLERNILLEDSIYLNKKIESLNSCYNELAVENIKLLEEIKRLTKLADNYNGELSYLNTTIEENKANTSKLFIKE